jgi:alpha-galactosidase
MVIDQNRLTLIVAGFYDRCHEKNDVSEHAEIQKRQPGGSHIQKEENRSNCMKRSWTGRTIVLLMLAACGFVNAQQKDLAPTPPMGWSTWNHFHHDISDALVRAQADAMVASGMRDAGYVYIHIDGGWEGERDASGVLRPNKNFPDMKALGEYIHSKGLKFGLYTGPGPRTCAGAPASYGYEAQDAKMFASWGVDYLKYDLCSFREIMAQQSGAKIKDAASSGRAAGYSEIMASEPAEVVEKADTLMVDAYEKMHQALLATGRPMLFSLCQYGYAKVWEWGPQVGAHMWRTSGDVSDSYSSVVANGFGEAGLAAFAGPGHWNDPDFLEVGDGKLNTNEARTNFSLWALLAAPLMAGNDMTKMTPETRSILLNQEVIEVDQDRLGKQGDRLYTTGPLEVWSKPLAGGDLAVGLFNKTVSPTKITLKLSAAGWIGPAIARDLWAHSNIGEIHDEYAPMVPGHGVVMLRLSRPK